MDRARTVIGELAHVGQALLLITGWVMLMGFLYTIVLLMGLRSKGVFPSAEAGMLVSIKTTYH